MLATVNSLSSKVSNKYGAFMDELQRKLSGDRFTVRTGLTLYPYCIDLLAVKSRLEASKFGIMNRFILVTGMASTDANMIQDFSNRMTKYVLNHSPTFIPRGFGSATLSVPVIVSEDFSDDVKQWVTKTLPTKHWAAFEFPVLFSIKNRELYYCQKTPIWGCAYYHGFRKFVEKILRF